MSLIAYYDGRLIADDHALLDSGICRTNSKMDKIRVSESNKFAFAYCGEEWSKQALDVLDCDLLAALTKAYAGDTQPVLTEHEVKHVIVLTRMDAYCLNKEFIKLPRSGLYSHGCVGDAFIGALAVKHDPIEAAKFACKTLYGFEPNIRVVYDYTLDSFDEPRVTK